jgi:hypothetical protein
MNFKKSNGQSVELETFKIAQVNPSYSVEVMNARVLLPIPYTLS